MQVTKDKRASSILVTGASSGIGLAAVRRFSRAGYRVAATVRKQADEDRLRSELPDIDVLNLDLNDEEAINSVIGGYLSNQGGLDVVVNNAGFACIGPVEELTMDQWRRQLETNFFAVVNICRLALPFMRERRSGRIIQVSSGMGVAAVPIFAPYASSKWALEGFSTALRYEMAPFGVYVSIIGPGPVESKFDANRDKPEDSELRESPYVSVYSAAAERTAKAHKKESPASDVVDKIWIAATARRPALRYAVGPLGYAAAASRMVPQRIVEKALVVKG